MNTECNGNLLLRAKEEICKTGGAEKHTWFKNKGTNPCRIIDSCFLWLCLRFNDELDFNHERSMTYIHVAVAAEDVDDEIT
jgi:hypothetical protein